MENNIFTQLSLVIAVAAAVSLVMRLLRQPLIVGYILTGILAGPSFLHLIGDKETFESFSSIGIALLLFIIGLGLNATIIRKLGKTVLLVATLEIVVMGLLGYLIAKGFGSGHIEALILGVALTFSSTIIVIKLLNDKREQTRLYGQICIGILLVQDIIATIALVFLSAGSGGDISILQILVLVIKGALIATILSFISIEVLPRLTKFIASSQELLFLFAIAWGFGIASIFQLSGFSIEVGALFAGVSLSALPYTQEIAARLKPLRDFFVVVFFIVLGEGLQLSDLNSALVPAIIFSAMVIFSKPLLIMAGLGILGYTKRTSFKAGLPIAQISEFSIIMIIIAQGYGLVSAHISAVVTLVAIITFAASTYLMRYDDQLYELLEDKLRLFERRVIKEGQQPKLSYPVVLFGYHKGGHEFVRAFRDMRKRFVVVDYDPDIIETLEHQRINYIYGDATDFELLQELDMEKTKLVVSTITDYETNLSLIRHLSHINPDLVLICHAGSIDEAAELYHHGATYVMMPHFIGSEQISGFIKRRGLSKSEFQHYRAKHLLLLEEQRSAL